MFGRRRNSGSNDVLPNATNYQEKTVFATDNGVPPPQSPYAQGYQDASAQSPYAQPQGYRDAQPQGYRNTPLYGDTGTVTEMRPISGAPQQEVLPMVFASREHSNIYIYEYPDRLEYYLRTATSMYLFNTVKK